MKNVRETRAEFETMKRRKEIVLTGVCSTCGKKTDTCFHHVLPIHAGGTNILTNIIEVCYDCHSKIHVSNHRRINDEEKAIISEVNTKKYKIVYSFSINHVNIQGTKYGRGYNETIDCINAIIDQVNNSGGNIRWGKTNIYTHAPYGARKTINDQATYYNEEYKLCRREYDCGYIEIYVPNKRGLKKVV